MAYEGFRNLNTSVQGLQFYDIVLNICGMTIEQTSFGLVDATMNMILNVFSSKMLIYSMTALHTVLNHGPIK